MVQKNTEKWWISNLRFRHHFDYYQLIKIIYFKFVNLNKIIDNYDIFYRRIKHLYMLKFMNYKYVSIVKFLTLGVWLNLLIILRLCLKKM